MSASRIALSQVAEPVDVSPLRARVAGEVVLPGDESWDAARQAWNTAVDQQPEAVVYAESADDVVEVVRFARAHGLRIAPQGTGHGASALSTEGTILLKTSRMRGVEIDPVARRARAEAGALWIEVVEPAAEHGLVALHGSSPDVGVVGYTLGGGMGWLARHYGLATNSVLAVEIVTADGRFVRADRENEPDLFWAVRGGGGSFGIVTAIEFALYPLMEVYAGWLMWPLERAQEVLTAWREWVRNVPDTITSVGRMLQIPPLPQIPEPLRGRSFVVVEVAFMGGEEDGAELVRPLRELGPAMDTVATMPAKALSRLHQDPEDPSPGVGDGMLLSDLTPEAIESIVAVAGADTQSPLVSLEFRHTGGALAKASPGNGALASLAGEFAMFGVGIAMAPEVVAAIEERIDAIFERLAPWEAGRYLNFTEGKRGKVSFYPEQSYHRLRRIRAKYDPQDLFRANHPIAH